MDIFYFFVRYRYLLYAHCQQKTAYSAVFKYLLAGFKQDTGPTFRNFNLHLSAKAPCYRP